MAMVISVVTNPQAIVSLHSSQRIYKIFVLKDGSIEIQINKCKAYGYVKLLLESRRKPLFLWPLI